MLKPVLAATSEIDVTLAYTNTPRPFDADGLRDLVGEHSASVILVEPYLEGTSAHVVSRALATVPHRLLSLGVGRSDLHRYGTPADHSTAHGLDPAGLRRSIAAFLR